MKHVCNGAMLQCTTGTMPCSLSVTNNPIVKSDGQLVATMADCVPFVNIKPFGQCLAQMTPSGPLPCNLALVGSWLGTHATFLVNGNPALLSTSKLTCAMGSISITMPAQMTMAKGGGVSGASIGSIDIPPVDINLPEEGKEDNQEDNSAEGGEASSQSEASNETNSQTTDQSQNNEEEQEKEIVEKRIEIELKYPDGTIPEGVGFKIFDESDVELATGTLDDNGYTLVEGLSTDKVKVVFTEDKRPKPLIEKETNPNFKEGKNKFTLNEILNGFADDTFNKDYKSPRNKDKELFAKLSKKVGGQL